MAADVQTQIVALLPRLRRFARGLAGSSADADDLVQGACERALRGINTWEPGTRLDSWMFRIVHNLWIDTVRRKRPEPAGDISELDIVGDDGRTAEARMELAQVRAAIAALPEQHRDVLVLVCIEDLTYREAAVVLQVPTGTVMSRLARARKALAAALEPPDADRLVKAEGA